MPTFMIFLVIHIFMFSAEVTMWRAGIPEKVEEIPKGDIGVIYSMINQERMKEGLSLLKLDDTLSHLAWAYADDMVRRDYFGHINPEGENVGDRLDRARMAYSLAGEILAENRSAEGAVEAWLKSPGHYEAIMQEGYEKMGIGVVESDDDYKIYVVVFYRPLKFPNFNKTVIFGSR
ncbi:MAG: hypothetical protein DRH44_00545 [Candidatus Coatesbacteria bacterium]|nr:MAG: hypothetical protein DRH44_00545 [Candidatus Coatesbacteria bacterium]